MRFRKLRIAVTVLSLAACVLLAASWVRSYRTFDELHMPLIGPRSLTVTIQVGNVGAILHRTHRFEWNANAIPSPYFGTDAIYTVNEATWGFAFGWRPEDINVAMPHWFLILLSILFVAASLMRWRFSLRTLLIAATLVAVVLGLIVAAN